MRIDAIDSSVYASTPYWLTSPSADYMQGIGNDVSGGIGAVESQSEAGIDGNFDDILDEMQKMQSQNYNVDMVKENENQYLTVEASEGATEEFFSNQQGGYAYQFFSDLQEVYLNRLFGGVRQNGFTKYQMNQAIDAYNMNMGIF